MQDLVEMTYFSKKLRGGTDDLEFFRDLIYTSYELTLRELIKRDNVRIPYAYFPSLEKLNKHREWLRKRSSDLFKWGLK
jgi:hypothetical protein